MTIKKETYMTCPDCRGTGEEPSASFGKEYGVATCSRCNGSGEIKAHSSKFISTRPEKQ